MASIASIVGREKALIGMIHVQALPGTPRHAMPMREIIGRAVDEAKLLADAGFDALLLENMHDVPYLAREVGPEIIAAMTAITAAVRESVSVPLGVQILAGANRAALAVAHAAGAQFIRAEGFVFASIADEGLLAEADAGPLLRERKRIGAEDIKILADIKKKHSSHAITSDVDIAETAKAAAFFGADGVIVTGIATAEPTSVDDIEKVKAAVSSPSLTAGSVPVLVGSGVTPDTAGALLKHADGLIVGSWYKKDGQWVNDPDADRVKQLITGARAT
jgi:membrane complex biogenesis BtpA family protein